MKPIRRGKPSENAACILQGHIALDRAVFPTGTPGLALDTLARAPLWAMGLNYRHGTGHGVGAALNVHEGPQSISTRCAPAPEHAPARHSPALHPTGVRRAQHAQGVAVNLQACAFPQHPGTLTLILLLLFVLGMCWSVAEGQLSAVQHLIVPCCWDKSWPLTRHWTSQR